MLTDVKISPGDEFVHDSFLDTQWKPRLGQRYKDAPKARMRVSRVTETTIYYTFLDGRGRHFVHRDLFIERFGEQFKRKE